MKNETIGQFSKKISMLRFYENCNMGLNFFFFENFVKWIHVSISRFKKSTIIYLLFFSGDVRDLNDLGVIIVNSSQYSRYRSVLKRVQGVEDHWMHNSLIVSLGGFTTPTRRTYVLFCREIFDYAELEEHPYLCNHLGILINDNYVYFLNIYCGK